MADQSSSEMSYPCSLASYGSERATLISASQWRGARLRLNLRGEAAVEDHLHKTRAWLRQATLTFCAEHGAAWSGDAAQTSCLLLIDSGAIRLYVTPSERGRCSPRDVARANRKAVGNENCRISPDETPPNCAPGIIRLRREYRQRAARPAPARTCDSADPAALEIGSCREDNTGITAALRPDVRVLGACALPVQGMRRKRTRLPRAVRGAPCL